AAATAASMSAAEPCASSASALPVAGSNVVKRLPSRGASKAPLTKCPNVASCRFSQARASPSASGAGPYYMVPKSGAPLMTGFSSDRVAVEGRIAAGDMMLELALDVGEQAGGADPEQFWLQPFAPQFLLHQELVVQHVLRGRDAARGLEA